jgi:hypothetical protein
MPSETVLDIGNRHHLAHVLDGVCVEAQSPPALQ